MACRIDVDEKEPLLSGSFSEEEVVPSSSYQGRTTLFIFFKIKKKDFNTSIEKYCKLDVLYFQYLTMYVKYLAPFVKILLRLAWKMLKPAEL